MPSFEARKATTPTETFHGELHSDLRGDHVLANPPFNDPYWFQQGRRRELAVRRPAKGIAKFAWAQHFIHHLAQRGADTAEGMAGFVLAIRSMSTNQSGEGNIRRALIEAEVVDCMVDLAGQLFYSTQTPACL
jgi:type I restriction enzyme M protein